MAESKLKQAHRELERARDKQADHEARASKLDDEARRYDERAARASSPATATLASQQADRKRKDAGRARQDAATALKAVSAAQKKVHRAEAELSKAKAEADKKAAAKGKREREKRERQEALARAREIDALRATTTDLQKQMRAAPWSASPEKISVLFIAASPEDQEPLRLDHEVREIQQRVRMSEHRDAVDFQWRPASRVTDLLQALNETRPHVVHFSGHGDQDSLAFEDDDGKTKPLANEDLAQLLRLSSDRIRLAVFNSCHSAGQAKLACAHIDAAIGMDTSIADEAAKVFAGQFYNAVGFGRSLQDAFDQAVLQVKLVTGATGGAPELYAAEGVSPDEIYLVKPRL